MWTPRKLTLAERAALLQPQYMTPEQIADLVARARASTTQVAIDTGRKVSDTAARKRRSR